MGDVTLAQILEFWVSQQRGGPTLPSDTQNLKKRANFESRAPFRFYIIFEQKVSASQNSPSHPEPMCFRLSVPCKQLSFTEGRQHVDLGLFRQAAAGGRPRVTDPDRCDGLGGTLAAAAAAGTPHQADGR